MATHAQYIPIEIIYILIHRLSMIENSACKDATIFLYCFWLQEVCTIRKSEVLRKYPTEVKSLSDRLIDDAAKRFLDITDERLSLIKFLMIKSLIQIESIQREECFDKVKKKCISDIEEEIIPIDLCPRISPHPLHF